ncbi:GNAT family N-acetyltransferase [Alkaliphilus peptidifermentans]|uniref:Protein N-acetyltransferase, RimJ/RimL family n=1 Tax=Alkaliphilus peptidifermentans DSM 18978 TaxID=1120976 RepID=A0A1G5KWV7_9FIRM|nr:GNAT family protein [Alkaliphilus peptidifermentans]SCZ04540.1 Protein N-acetyltransferase, RimJ/RimL family [Alkaliphilus peptidifermentans DSM 18978]
MNIKLEEFSRENIKQLISWVPDEKLLMQFAGPAYVYPLTEEQLLEDIRKMKETGEILMFKAIYEETNLIIGHIQLLRIDKINKIATLGRVLIGEEAARGKGLGTIVVKKALNYAFNNMNLDVIRLNVFDFNNRAIKCYKMMGFKIVKTTENCVTVNGTGWSGYTMEISKEEFYGKTK